MIIMLIQNLIVICRIDDIMKLFHHRICTIYYLYGRWNNNVRIGMFLNVLRLILIYMLNLWVNFNFNVFRSFILCYHCWFVQCFRCFRFLRKFLMIRLCIRWSLWSKGTRILMRSLFIYQFRGQFLINLSLKIMVIYWNEFF